MQEGEPGPVVRAALARRLEVGWNPGTKSAGPALPFRDIPARSPAVAMADQARSHGSGSYRVDTHDPVAGGRDNTAMAVRSALTELWDELNGG